MTLITAWISSDRPNEVSAMYIMTDSRISWGDRNHWDSARKIYNFNNHPDILGYCGEVLFTSQVLSQIVTLGDSGLLFKNTVSFDDKFEIIKNKIQSIFSSYPLLHSQPNFTILHCGKTLNSTFGCYVLKWDNKMGWTDEKITLTENTDILYIDGSGQKEFSQKVTSNFNSNSKKTSREIFQTFIETLINIKDLACGGPPQLAGIYRGDVAKTFGLILDNKLYTLGFEIEELKDYSSSNIEWRNHLFERCDPNTKQRFPFAQRQPIV